MSGFTARTMPAAFEILTVSSNPADRVMIEARWKYGEMAWCVRRRGFVLGKDGEWEYEPSGGSQDEDFWERTRYESPEIALEYYDKRKDR
jgi:hypothetical protein